MEVTPTPHDVLVEAFAAALRVSKPQAYPARLVDVVLAHPDVLIALLVERKELEQVGRYRVDSVLRVYLEPHEPGSGDSVLYRRRFVFRRGGT